MYVNCGSAANHTASRAKVSRSLQDDQPAKKNRHLQHNFLGMSFVTVILCVYVVNPSNRLKENTNTYANSLTGGPSEIS